MGLIERGITWGIWWGVTHPWHSIATYVLLKNPATRGLMIDHLKLLGRGAIAGTRGSWASIMNRLLIPGAVIFRARAAPVVARIGVGAAIAAPPVAVGAGVLVTAGIIAGVHTGLLQKTGMIGPGAQKTSDPNWFGGLEMNPSMFTMGTVV